MQLEKISDFFLSSPQWLILAKRKNSSYISFLKQGESVKDLVFGRLQKCLPSSVTMCESRLNWYLKRSLDLLPQTLYFVPPHQLFLTMISYATSETTSSLETLEGPD